MQTRRQRRYSSRHSITTTLDGGERSSSRPGHYPRAKEHGTHRIWDVIVPRDRFQATAKSIHFLRRLFTDHWEQEYARNVRNPQYTQLHSSLQYARFKIQSKTITYYGKKLNKNQVHPYVIDSRKKIEMSGEFHVSITVPCSHCTKGWMSPTIGLKVAVNWNTSTPLTGFLPQLSSPSPVNVRTEGSQIFSEYKIHPYSKRKKKGQIRSPRYASILRTVLKMYIQKIR